MLKDGTHLNADIVVLATGYDNMRTTVQKVMGNKVAARCNDVWDLDEEGELNSVSRYHPNFARYWFTEADHDELDLAAEWPSEFLVHGWKSCTMPHLLQVSGIADKGSRGRTDAIIYSQLVDSSVLYFVMPLD